MLFHKFFTLLLLANAANLGPTSVSAQAQGVKSIRGAKQLDLPNGSGGNGNGNGNAYGAFGKLLLASDQSKASKDQFIVVLEDSTDDVRGKAQDLLATVGGTQKGKAYGKVLKGFAAKMTLAQAEAMSGKAGVKYVEQDQIVTKSAVTWGLDRIDDVDLPLDGTYDSGFDLEGSGAAVYVIDTGINPTHNEFEGRATTGAAADFVGDGGNGIDCDGHGTHVAGTVAGKTYGVAPGADVIGVRVLNCQGLGSSSDVIAGMEWVAQQCPGGTNSDGKKCVANMSLGGGYSETENQVVTNIRDAGVVMAVAAGNDDADACDYSPASAADALSVGSTTIADARSSFSNYGACVDVFAPGSSITSAWYTSDTATTSISGTSMASPHVAGVAALIRAQNPSWGPDEVESKLLGDAIAGTISGVPLDTENLMLRTLGTCGNGQRDAVEECEGDDLNDATCSSVPGLPNLSGTGLVCSGCSYDTSACTGCGNGIIDAAAGEVCDSYNFGGVTCPEGGRLSCSSDCSDIDYVGCLSTLMEETNQSAKRRSSVSFEIPVNYDTTSINIAISGGSGDADLYVRYGSPPTSSTYDCRPYAQGNDESCSYNSSGGNSQGTYYAMVYGYRSFNGVNVKIKTDGDVRAPGPSPPTPAPTPAPGPSACAGYKNLRPCQNKGCTWSGSSCVSG